MRMGSNGTRRSASLLLQAVMLVFLVTYTIQAAAAALSSEARDAVKTEVAASTPFSPPSERPVSLPGKVHFAILSFNFEQVIDPPGREMSVNAVAITTNSHRHNIFSVQINANAP